MNVWSHHPTIFNGRMSLRIAGLLTLCVAFITTLFFLIAPFAQAAPGINETVIFQGRLLNASGAVVADGYYNMEFTIYQDGDGQTAGNPSGTQLWSESYVNNNANEGVQVRNGYFSVQLGSNTAFGSSIDWNQDTLWLSMNVAGTAAACTTFGSAPCTEDGEMLPMKRFTSAPYAMNAGQVGGKTADELIHNGTEQQTANFNISGTGQAATLQGNTSVIAPLFDRADAGTLNIGTTQATTINLGASNTDQTINIATSDTSGIKNLTVGSVYGASQTTIQGGSNGVTVATDGGFTVYNRDTSINSVLVGSNGSIDLNLSALSDFRVYNSSNTDLLRISDGGNITAHATSALLVNGSAQFANGITVIGDTASTEYTTPLGYTLSTAINIPNYSVGQYDSILAFGLPASSHATARGLLIADARSGDHQATIGILSPDENQIFGLSYNGSNDTAYLDNTANTIALQGNSLDILTAKNNGGTANVGIGNNASSGYALDVTGDINSSSAIRIGGTSTLTNSSLAFSAASEATVSAASGQDLTLSADSGSVTVSDDGVQVGDGTASGDATLFTLDSGTAAPSSAFVGSMYYDTTLGEVQCYEASGWGNCSSAPDTFVTLHAEYPSSVTMVDGTGTDEYGFCSSEFGINDGSSGQPDICDTDDNFSYYGWTSAEATAQRTSVIIQHTLPDDFDDFISGTTSITSRADATGSYSSYEIHKKTSDGTLTACTGSPTTLMSGDTAWTKTTLTGGGEPANCSFTAGDTLVVIGHLHAVSGGSAYMSDISFAYKRSN